MPGESVQALHEMVLELRGKEAAVLLACLSGTDAGQALELMKPEEAVEALKALPPRRAALALQAVSPARAGEPGCCEPSIHPGEGGSWETAAPAHSPAQLLVLVAMSVNSVAWVAIGTVRRC